MKNRDVNHNQTKDPTQPSPNTREREEDSFRPMPPTSQNVQNYLPNIVEVKFGPPSCSTHTQCPGTISAFSFEVNFKLQRESVSEHRVEIGLKSATLQLNLQPPQSVVFDTEVALAPKVEVEEKVKHSRKSGFSVHKPHFSTENSLEITTKTDILQISSGGSLEQPHWFFRAFGNRLLDRPAKDLVCNIRPNKEALCRCEFSLIVERSDWSYVVDVDANLHGLRRVFAILKLKEYCIRQIIVWNHIVETQLNNVMSKGVWKCSIKK